MATIARVLAGLSVVAWLVAVFTPLTSNEITGDTRLADVVAEAPWVIPFAAVPVLVAVLVALTRPRLPVAVLAIAIGGLCLTMILAMPMGEVLWDGMDDQGRPIGGMETDVRSIGWFAALAGSLLLAAAGAVALRPATTAEPAK
ncbi:MAG: hypothetical protein GXX86_09415 [Propionibacterium sp.]|nr:hypothetical protein [Propionibacterium sp.]